MFIKDVYGRESDVLYNKNLCEGLLMTENDMVNESLAKFGTCVDLFYEKHGTIPS